MCGQCTKKGLGTINKKKDAGNRTLCPYRNFSQAIKSCIGLPKRHIGPKNRRPASINKKRTTKIFKLWFFEGKLYLKWDRGIGKYSGRSQTKILEKDLMYKLLSFSQVTFCPVSILSADYGDTMKALIDQLVRSIREIFVRSVLQNCSLNIFPYGPHNWSIRAQYYPFEWWFP